jgi:oxalate decarboxylase/phosphoglucose isomerase-like protein (cupin superfamily)
MPSGECRLIELPVVEDPQGNLAFAEAGEQIPFPIARTFHVYDVPAGAVRGGHAHRALEEVVFCVAGRLEATVDDGRGRQTFALEDPRVGLYLPPLVWYDLTGFAAGTVYVVLTSTRFEESDYIRDYDRFLAAVGGVAVGG